ncbi:MAG TPA: hypothetical protein VIN09_08900, partial [Chloroflexota bacterium]
MPRSIGKLRRSAGWFAPGSGASYTEGGRRGWTAARWAGRGKMTYWLVRARPRWDRLPELRARLDAGEVVR